jgi:sec-independent protein translocase protein TatB
VEFLGIGYQELLLVLVLLLVVVGPERLPHMAYQIGKAVRQMQSYARAVRDEFGEEIGFLEEQYKVVKGEIDSTTQELREHTARIDSEFREATAALNAPIPFPTAAAASSPAAVPAPAPADPVAAFAPPSEAAAIPPPQDEPKRAPLLF